jgi:hypothetical protein
MTSFHMDAVDEVSVAYIFDDDRGFPTAPSAAEETVFVRGLTVSAR